MKNKPETNERLTRKGVIVVLFALLIPVLIVILGFTIDYANIQRVRNEARMVADLSAKAAADTLARSGGDQAAAIQAAKDVAAENSISGTMHDLQTSDVIFGRATLQGNGSYVFSSGTSPFNSVRVNAVRDATVPGGKIPQFFGIFYGQPSFDLIQTSTATFRDVEICLVLDRSGSMKWKKFGVTTSTEKGVVQCQVPNNDSRWSALDDAIDVFLAELGATTVLENVAMVTFASAGESDCGGIVSTDTTLDQALTTDLTSIEAAMDVYNTSIWFGRTNITAGLANARQHMVSAGSANVDKFIIILTDGEHNVGDTPFAEATACAAAGIVVHTITFSDDANTADMITTAANGGGDHYHADDPNELESIFEGLAGSFAILTE